jgi:hypothetical protein
LNAYEAGEAVPTALSTWASPHSVASCFIVSISRLCAPPGGRLIGYLPGAPSEQRCLTGMRPLETDNQNIPKALGNIAMMSIQTAKLNGVEPMEWLTDMLERIVSGRTKTHQLKSLLSWNWQPSTAAST